MKTSKNSKNYKVRCTGYNKLERLFTKGKVYEVKNGSITNDDGFTYEPTRHITNVLDWLKKWYNFEVVEEKVEYKVGDRVIIEESNVDYTLDEPFAGKTGVIVAIDGCDPKYRYRVKPDNFTCSFGIFCGVKGYAPEEKEVKEDKKEEKIVITHDGKTTTATMYRGEMKFVGTARCCPEDTFDFKYGATLAMERMMKEVEKWEKARAEEESGWRVVNRPVKVGDYIRLTHKWFSFNKVGDIMKVSNTRGTTAFVEDKDHPRPSKQFVGSDYQWGYMDGHYEVVEKIKEPKFTKYKDGQFVRVVKKETHHFPVGQIVKVVEHKTGFVDEEGIVMCEGFCDNICGIAIQCVLPEEIAPLD